MLKWVLIPLIVVIAGCSQIPKEPALAFGKKCEVTENGTIVSSSVWIYSKAEGLKASEEACPKKEQKKVDFCVPKCYTNSIKLIKRQK